MWMDSKALLETYFYLFEKNPSKSNLDWLVKGILNYSVNCKNGDTWMETENLRLSFTEYIEHPSQNSLKQLMRNALRYHETGRK